MTDDYSTSYSALRTQCRSHFLDPNTMRMTNFLKHVAELLASERRQRREAENNMHSIMERGKNG